MILPKSIHRSLGFLTGNLSRFGAKCCQILDIFTFELVLFYNLKQLVSLSEWILKMVFDTIYTLHIADSLVSLNIANTIETH